MKNTGPELVPSQGVTPKTALWLLLLASGSCGIPNSGPPVGNSMPSVMAQDLSGQPQLLSSMKAPCILFFYTPSCQPCNRLLENLLIFFQEKEPTLIDLFLLVKRDKRETLRSKTLSGFPVLMISRNDWHNVFEVTRTPLLLFYQAQGQLIQKQLGWRSSTVQQRILNDFIRQVNNTELKDAPLRCNSALTQIKNERRSET